MKPNIIRLGTTPKAYLKLIHKDLKNTHRLSLAHSLTIPQKVLQEPANSIFLKLINIANIAGKRLKPTPASVGVTNR